MNHIQDKIGQVEVTVESSGSGRRTRYQPLPVGISPLDPQHYLEGLLQEEISNSGGQAYRISVGYIVKRTPVGIHRIEVSSDIRE